MTLAADGSLDAPVFRSPSYAGRATDLAAAPALSDRQLLSLLRRRIEDHLRPVVVSVRRAAPLAQRAQWALIGDACGASFLHAGEAIGEVAEARSWAERFLALGVEPLRGKQRFFVLRHAGRSETFMARGSCCLSYRIEGHEYCATCPFTADEERERRLFDWMSYPS